MYFYRHPPPPPPPPPHILKTTLNNQQSTLYGGRGVRRGCVSTVCILQQSNRTLYKLSYFRFVFILQNIKAFQIIRPFNFLGSRPCPCETVKNTLHVVPLFHRATVIAKWVRHNFSYSSGRFLYLLLARLTLSSSLPCILHEKQLTISAIRHDSTYSCGSEVRLQLRPVFITYLQCKYTTLKIWDE